MTPRPRRLPILDPVVAGTVCGIVSAVAYTAANVCLRAVTHCDPIWVSCVKAFPTLVLVGPCLIVLVARNQGLVPSLNILGLLLFAGALGQLGGNVVFQWSLGVVGMALTVPLSLGAMMVSGAILGRWLLREVVTSRMVVALVVLLAAIFILSAGASAAGRAVAQSGAHEATPPSMLHLMAGVAGACLAGLAYCVLGVVIRYSSSGGTPLSTILVTVSFVGTFGLGALSYLRVGPAAMWSTPPQDLAVMLLAGVCNALAFWSLSKALHLTSVVYVNALNASQTAMAAVAGVVFFHEAPTPAMFAGIALTAVGLMLMRGRRRDPAAGPSCAAPRNEAADRLQCHHEPAK